MALSFLKKGLFAVFFSYLLFIFSRLAPSAPSDAGTVSCFVLLTVKGETASISAEATWSICLTYRFRRFS
jgi:hypothetical protein